jgi:hypothetical protein
MLRKNKMTEAKLKRKNGQEDYETMISELAAKRTEDSKTFGKAEEKKRTGGI